MSKVAYVSPWRQEKIRVHELFEDNILTVEKMLEYSDVTLDGYVPSVDAIDFMNFIRLVLGEEPENSSPMAHYFLMDCVFQYDTVKPYFEARNINFEELKGRTIILCTREFGKSVLIVYLMLYLAARGSMPNFGPVYYGLYVSDSMRNGVRNTMETIGKVYQESVYLQNIFEDVRLVQDEVNFVRKPRTKKEIALYNEFVVKQKKDPKQVPGRMKRTFSVTGLGAAALPLDSILYTDTGSTTMGEVNVGDRILGDDGKMAEVTEKSEIFNRPIWKIELDDGRSIRVSDDHINNIYKKGESSKATGRKVVYKEMNVTTTKLLDLELYREYGVEAKKKYKYYIKDAEPASYSEKNFPLDPYLVGILLGDGHMSKDGGTRLEGLPEDVDYYCERLSQYDISRSEIIRNRSENEKPLSRIGIKKITKEIEELDMKGVLGSDKKVPPQYMFGSIEQRVSLLQGLMDTDGTVKKYGAGRFTNTSKSLAEAVVELTRSLGGIGYAIHRYERKEDGWQDIYEVIVNLEKYDMFGLVRKQNKLKRSLGKRFGAAIINITQIDTVQSQCIAVDNKNRLYVTDGYVITHNTGGRGSRDGLARPQFAIFDDMIPSEAEASSDTILENIESTIEADVLKALSGNGNFAIGIGTPYNKKDPIYRRVEQKSWLPVVFPRAENPPIDGMKESEFKSVWPDRHTFKQCRIDFIRARKASEGGDEEPMRKLMQENYLRIANEADRLVPESLLQWFNVENIIARAFEYNWYLTTDYTTTGSKGSDMSGAALWAVSHDGSWFMVDMVLRKMEIEEQYDTTFELIENVLDKVRWVEAGVELDGGQGAHVYSLEKKMLERNTHFSFAKQKGVDSKKRKGILSKLEGGSKHWRFRAMLPMFQNRKIWFADHLKESPDMRELLEEIKFTDYRKFNSKYDDGIDLISMVNAIDATYPSKEFSGTSATKKKVGMKASGINAKIWGKKNNTGSEGTAYDSYNG